MYFIISKIFYFLLQPIVWIILLLLLSFLLKQHKIKFALSRIALVLLLLSSNKFLVNELMHWWEYDPVPIGELQPDYDGIVLLGGVTNPDVVPHDRVYLSGGADRITHTAQLYLAGYAPKIILTGGSGKLLGDEVMEADQMFQVLRLCHVPDKDMLVEPSARNTRENAVRVKSLMQSDSQFKRLILVTSGYHMRRALGVFKKQGIPVTPFPTDIKSKHTAYTFHDYIIPDVGAFLDFHIILKEIFGYVIYAVLGYL